MSFCHAPTNPVLKISLSICSDFSYPVGMSHPLHKFFSYLSNSLILLHISLYSSLISAYDNKFSTRAIISGVSIYNNSLLCTVPSSIFPFLIITGYRFSSNSFSSEDLPLPIFPTAILPLW